MKKLYTTLLILVVLGLLFGTVRQAKAAESHNMTTEFSFTNNGSPNLWTYGHYTGGVLNKGAFQKFTGQLGLPVALDGFTECTPPPFPAVFSTVGVTTWIPTS